MSRIHYQLKKNLYRLKVYRRKGFGIHSPYAFHLVTNGIGGKERQEQLRDLQAFRKKAIELLQKEIEKRNLEDTLSQRYQNEIRSIRSSKAFDRLLFRLLHFSKAINPYYVGGGIGLPVAYMAKSNPKIKINWIEKNDEFTNSSEHLLKYELNLENVLFISGEAFTKMDAVDFIVFSENVSEKLFCFFIDNCSKIISENCFVIVRNIHGNEKVSQFWKHLKELEQFRLSFDFFHTGLLIAREGMQKQNYVRKYKF